jgi:hypothetical protein
MIFVQAGCFCMSALCPLETVRTRLQGFVWCECIGYLLEVKVSSVFMEISHILAASVRL